MPAKAIRSKVLSISCSEIMKLLADETRLQIVELLISGGRRVEEINARVKIDPTLLSYHLRILRQAKLIVGKRSGRHISYQISPQVRRSVQSRVLDFGCCKVSFNDRQAIPQA